MATKKKEIFFVREMPDDYEIDYSRKWSGKKKLLAQIAASKKKKKHKKAA